APGGLPAAVAWNTRIGLTAHNLAARVCKLRPRSDACASTRTQSEPVIEKCRKPGAAGGIVDSAIREVRGTRLRIRQKGAIVAARRPATDGGVGHVGMELKRITRAVAERLYWKAVALRKQIGAIRQIESLAVPLVDLLRPGIAERQPERGRPD